MISKKPTSYQKHLQKHFLIVSLCIILSISILGNLSVRYFFKSYISREASYNNSKITESVSTLVEEDMLTIQGFRAISASNNVYLRLLSLNNELILDSLHMRGQRTMMPQGAAPFPTISEMHFDSYPIYNSEGSHLFILEIGRKKGEFSTELQSQFIFALNFAFALSIVIALIFSIVYSNIQSKKITHPLSKLISNTAILYEGKYTEFHPVESRFFEINELYKSLSSLNERLRSQNDLRKRLTSDMAHELRNPLSILRSHIEAFVDGIWEPNEMRLLKCNDEILRLTRLIDELNELSIVENSLHLNISKNDMEKTMDKVLAGFDILLVEKNISVIKNYSGNMTLSYDEDRIIQVLVNILSNSLKYSANNSSIVIETFEEASGKGLKIKDFGIGISSKDLPFIFERFYRSDTLRNKETGGLGIGLAISKAICDAHGFRLSAQSELGKGSIFTIFF